VGDKSTGLAEGDEVFLSPRTGFLPAVGMTRGLRAGVLKVRGLRLATGLFWAQGTGFLPAVGMTRGLRGRGTKGQGWRIVTGLFIPKAWIPHVRSG